MTSAKQPDKMPVGGGAAAVQQSGGRQREHTGAHGPDRYSPSVLLEQPAAEPPGGCIGNRQMRRNYDKIRLIHVAQRPVSPGFDTALGLHRTPVETDDLGLEQIRFRFPPQRLVPEIGNREGVNQAGNAGKEASVGGHKCDPGH